MKSREISRSKIGPFSLACTDPYIGIGWEYQSRLWLAAVACVVRWPISDALLNDIWLTRFTRMCN